MKHFRKLIASAIVFLAFITAASAQATATATATATVVTAISIAKVTDMNFGNISVQAGTGGTVVLAPDGTRSRTSGVTLPASAGTVTAATFTVSGLASYTYAITLPTTVVLTHSAGVETMTASAFTSTPSATGTLASGGTETVAVGATLTVAAAQLPGVYVSGNFDVTVNYN